MRFRRGWVLPLAVSSAAAQPDAVDVLARFGAVTRENASRVRNYTCLETIERQYYRARLTSAPRNCDELAKEKKKRGYRLTLASTDRLRLEVRAGATTEMFSWPGANRFDDRELWDIIGYGPAASGPFGMLPLQVVQGDAGDFYFLGEAQAGGRKLFQYSFRVPEERSHYYIHIGGGDVPTAWDGTVDLDPETSELVHLNTRTSEQPARALVCEIATSSEYGQVKIGSRELPLSRETRQRFIDRSGAEVESVVTFSGCRAYQAESRVRFGGASEQAPAPAAVAGAPLFDLPPGLPVTIDLSGAIDSAVAAGGDRFTGAVTKPVKDSRGRVLLEGGSVVAGRLIEVAVHVQPPEVALVLHVETARIGGADVPLHLTGRTPAKRAWLREILSSFSVGAGGGSVSDVTISHQPPAPEGELDALSFPGTQKVLPAGFRTEWVTVKP